MIRGVSSAGQLRTEALPLLRGHRQLFKYSRNCSNVTISYHSSVLCLQTMISSKPQPWQPAVQ